MPFDVLESLSAVTNGVGLTARLGRWTRRQTGSQNSNWMSSGSRNTTTVPIGVTAAGVNVMPRRASSASHDGQLIGAGDAEGEVVEPGPHLIEARRRNRRVLAQADDEPDAGWARTR